MNNSLVSPHLQKVCQYIAGHYGEPLEVQQLAKVAGVSITYLTHLFHQELQTTPKRYVWQYRLEKAAEMLNQTGWSISQVGYRIGFQSKFHFSRLFKQQYHLSPRNSAARTRTNPRFSPVHRARDQRNHFRGAKPPKIKIRRGRTHGAPVRFFPMSDTGDFC